MLSLSGIQLTMSRKKKRKMFLTCRRRIWCCCCSEDFTPNVLSQSKNLIKWRRWGEWCKSLWLTTRAKQCLRGGWTPAVWLVESHQPIAAVGDKERKKKYVKQRSRPADVSLLHNLLKDLWLWLRQTHSLRSMKNIIKSLPHTGWMFSNWTN